MVVAHCGALWAVAVGGTRDAVSYQLIHPQVTPGVFVGRWAITRSVSSSTTSESSVDILGGDGVAPPC